MSGLLSNKRKFNEAAPSNYVAGLGRGAVGFTTRSDIGPARAPEAPAATGPSDTPRTDFGKAPAGYVPGAGRGAGGMGERQDRVPRDDDDDDDVERATGDDMAGLFAGGTYDEDDVAADAIYEAVDRRIEERRQRRKQANKASQEKEKKKEGPTMHAHFADAKKELAKVSAEEWMMIPEIGDTTVKKKKREVFTPAADSTSLLSLASKTDGGNMDTSISSGIESAMTDLSQVGKDRGAVLSVKLDQVSDSVSGQTVVDPKGYLTDLNSIKVNTETEISDIKKSRTLLSSVTQTNPSHGPGWIAAARLEEAAGRMVAARSVIQKGCEACPDNEDVWIEAARLQTPENAKTVLARAVHKLPQSVKIWMYAAQLETETLDKKRVLRRGLTYIPNSVRLWKAAIELEPPESAKIMLQRATECVPHSTEIWLALAKLETYENARGVLNAARGAIPTDKSIWMTAAQLEEAHNNTAMVDKIVEKAIKSLAANQVVIPRDDWIVEAENAERSGYVKTCQAIVRNTVMLGVEDEDRKRTWMEDADSSLAHNAPETARAVLAYALSVFPGQKSLWMKAAELEKSKGTRESLDLILQKATSMCPSAEVFWLMGAKEKWNAGDITAARTILGEAFAANSDSEDIWLAAVKLENQNNEKSRARFLLERAQKACPTARVWLKSALLEREIAEVGTETGSKEANERGILEQALESFPSFFKFWIMMAQLEERQGNHNAARQVYAEGVKTHPTCVALWRCYSQLEMRLGEVARARGILEKARKCNKGNPDVWALSIQFEIEAKDQESAGHLLAKALQVCPNAGKLWALSIQIASRADKKAKSMDALRRCDNDPLVLVAVARLFVSQSKLDKARSWFNKAIALDEDHGDNWAYFYRFEMAHGNDEQRAAVVRRCTEADPRHGDLWAPARKESVRNWYVPAETILREVASKLTPF